MRSADKEINKVILKIMSHTVKIYDTCIGCTQCVRACPTDFLSVRVYLGAETTRSLGLAY